MQLHNAVFTLHNAVLHFTAGGTTGCTAGWLLGPISFQSTSHGHSSQQMPSLVFFRDLEL